MRAFFEDTATRLAQSEAFVQRTSKLSGSMFAKVWVLGFIETPEASLGQLAQVAAELGVSISEQGLDQRLTDQAVTFLKALFVESLTLFRNDCPLACPWLHQFSRIYLQDSSVIALPDNLRSEFAGCGGDGPAAAVKVQLLFEFLHGNLEAVALQDGRAADQSYDAYLDQVQPGALMIQDLGYFVLEHFARIAAQNGYFLSRFDPQTALYDARREDRIDLMLALSQETPSQFERPVRIGVRTRLACRALFMRLPQEMAERRRRKAHETAQRKGRTVSPRSLHLLDWNIYITNVPETMLSLPQVALLYGLRWQIELIFKLWKSQCALDRIAGLRRARVLCELYGKMIGISLTHWLIAPRRWDDHELSAVKAHHILQRFAIRIAACLTCGAALSQVVALLLKRLRCFGAKDKRRTHLSTLHRLCLEVSRP